MLCLNIYNIFVDIKKVESLLSSDKIRLVFVLKGQLQGQQERGERGECSHAVA